MGQILLCIFLILFIYHVQGADNQNSIMYVNDVNNVVAEKSLEAVLGFLRRNPSIEAPQVKDLVRVNVNGTDAPAVLSVLCDAYGKMLEDKKPPALVLDTTVSGIPSETVKSFTAALGIPTVSTAYGQEFDIRSWRSLDDDEAKYLIQIMPPADLIPEVIRTIVTTLDINNAAILFDESYVMDHKYKSLLQNIPTRHLITAVQEGEELKAQLTKMKELDVVNFFILGKLQTIKNVLDAATSNKYFGKKFAWFAITQDRGTLKCGCTNATVMFLKPEPDSDSRDRLGKLRTVYSLTAEPEIAAAFYFDVMLKAFTALKSMMDNNLWPKMDYVTCEEFKEENRPRRSALNLRDALKKEEDPPSYGPLLIERNGHSYMEFNMKIEKVTIINSQSVSAEDVGSWKASLTGPINVKDTPGMKNFTATTVYRIIIVEQKPFIFENPNEEERGSKPYVGYCIDLIDEIRALIEFDYELIPARDNLFGNMDENGQWNGMIKELMEKRADIGLGSLSVMAERENVIDFTVPYYDLVGITILMKKSKTPTSLFKFLTVLETDVWLCILAAYFFTSFLMWVFDRWSPYSFQNNREKYKDDEEKREFNLKECLWFCMTSLTPQDGLTYFGPGVLNLLATADNESLVDGIVQRGVRREGSEPGPEGPWQCGGRKCWPAPVVSELLFFFRGGGEAPKNLSGRLVAATWWLFGFIIIASYTANLAAFLTVSRLDTPVESLDDLSKQYKIQYAPLNGSSAMTYFQRMADIETRFYEIWKDMSLNDSLSEVERAKLAVWDYPVSDKYTKMWQAMQEARLPNTLKEALDRVRDSPSSSEGFAYIGDATDIRYQVLTNCDFQMVGEEFSRKPYAIAVQQGSPLKDQFNNAILQLLNKRKLEKLKETWWTNNDNKAVCEKQNEETDGISIQNIGGVFIVIFVGIGMACITLAFEYWWYRDKRNPKIIAKPGPKAKEAFKTMEPNLDQYQGNLYSDRFMKRDQPAMPSVEQPW